MANPSDFSEGIKLIRVAHEDATSIISNWRDLIEKPGELTLSIKNPGGIVEEVTLPTIREAINRYLGGVYEELSLSDGANTVTIKLNESGDVVAVREDGTSANIIAPAVIATTISGKNGSIQIIGSMSTTGGVFDSATFTSINATNGTISNSKFSGTTTISGASTIEGTLQINKIKATNLDTGNIQYKKQVVRFGTAGTRDESLIRAETDSEFWLGGTPILNRVGIHNVPTWADCTYTPNDIAVDGGATLHIYWGPLWDMLVQNTDGSYDFHVGEIAEWPYKMYKAVQPGVYSIHWLPITDDYKGRIHYARTGVGAKMRIVNEIRSSGGGSAFVASKVDIPDGVCHRFLSETEAGEGGASFMLYRV